MHPTIEALKQRLLSLSARLIPVWTNTLPPDERRRVELAIRLQPIYWACVPFYSTVYALMGVWESVAVLLTFGVNTFITLALMRDQRRLQFAQHFAIANGLFALWGIGWFMGGATSPVFWWPVAMPLTAGMFVGKRGALAWLGVIVAGSLAQIALELAGVHAPDRLSLTAHRWVDLMTHPGLAIMLFMISASYERAKDTMRDSLIAMRDQADRARAEAKMVLDNAGQGFLMLDTRGRLGASHSAIVERWFGPVTAGASFQE